MKFAVKAFAMAHILGFTGLAFGQAVNPPANPATGTQNPNANNPLTNPYPAPSPDNRPIARDVPPPAGPALDDRSKVSCPPGQEAVVQGSRLLCVTRSNPPTQDQVNPNNRPVQ